MLPRLATREILGLGELTEVLIQHFAGFQMKHFIQYCIVQMAIEVASVINRRGLARIDSYQIYLSAIDTLVTGLQMANDQILNLYCTCRYILHIIVLLRYELDILRDNG